MIILVKVSIVYLFKREDWLPTASHLLPLILWWDNILVYADSLRGYNTFMPMLIYDTHWIPANVAYRHAG